MIAIRKQKYTDEELLNSIREKTIELGRTPTSEEVNNGVTIIHRFGSYSKALEKIGIEPIRRSRNTKLTNQELLSEFKREIERLESTSFAIYKNERKNGASPNYLYKRLKVDGWYELLELAEIKGEKWRRKPDEYYFKKLWHLTEKLGHAPTAEECYLNGFSRTFFKRFGSYLNFLESAGVKYTKKAPIKIEDTKEKLIESYIEFSNKLGYPATMKDLDEDACVHDSHIYVIHFGSMYNLRKECGFVQEDRRRFTEKYVLSELVKVYQEVGDKLIKPEFDVKLPFSITTAFRYMKVTGYRELLEKVKCIDDAP